MAFRTQNRHSIQFLARRQMRRMRLRMAEELRRVIEHIDPTPGRTA